MDTHRNICGDALPALRHDLGEERGADGMEEEGRPHQASKTDISVRVQTTVE